MFKYKIVCLQDAPLSSWDSLHTKRQIRDKFINYAFLEWDHFPGKAWFTLDNISQYWDVHFEKATIVDIVREWFEND